MRASCSCSVRGLFIGGLALLLAFLPMRGGVRTVHGAVQVASYAQHQNPDVVHHVVQGEKGPNEERQESNNEVLMESNAPSERSQDAVISSPASPSKNLNEPLRQTSEVTSGTIRSPVPPSQASPSHPIDPTVESVPEPPKRLGLAITGTAMTGGGLLFMVILLSSNGGSATSSDWPGSLFDKTFVFLAASVAATGAVMALIGWNRYDHWKSWSRSQPSVRSSQHGRMNPMLTLKLHQPRQKMVSHERLARPRFGFSWSWQF